MSDPAENPHSLPARAWRFVGKRLRGWRERHRHPFNFAIHLVGIPLALAGVVLLCFQQWMWGIGAFLAGYALQFIGHRVEGNDVGEVAAIKWLLGLPYVPISPRWQQASSETSQSTPTTTEAG